MSASEVNRFWSKNHRNTLSLLSIVTIITVSMAFVGCDWLGSSPKSDQKPKQKIKTSTIKTKTQPKQPLVPKTTKNLIVKGDQIEVSLEDFKQAVRRQVFFAPPSAFRSGRWKISKGKLKSPALQARLVQSIVSQKIVDQASKKRNLRVSPEEIQAHIKQSKTLSRFFPTGIRQPDGVLLPISMATLGVTMDDVREMARLNVLRAKLTEKLLTEFTDEHFWLAWSYQNNKVNTLVVPISNTPQSYELDTFVGREKAKIQAHFDANKSKYQTPRLVKLTMLKAPPKTKDLAKRLTQALAALNEGKSPAAVAKKFKLTLKKDATLLRAEDKRAYHSAVGTRGQTLKGARGAYVWIVQDFIEPVDATLTPGLSREIASELMRTKSIVPSVSSSFAKARKILQTITYKDGKAQEASVTKAKQALKIQGLRAVETGFFVEDRNGFIPKIGLAESLMPYLFKLDATKNPILPRAVLSREKVYAVALLAYQKATKQDFEKVKASFKTSYLKSQRSRLIENFVRLRSKQDNMKMNLIILRNHYGALPRRK